MNWTEKVNPQDLENAITTAWETANALNQIMVDLDSHTKQTQTTVKHARAIMATLHPYAFASLRDDIGDKPTEVQSRGTIPCPECEAEAEYAGVINGDTNEIIKFFWIVCDECGWDQYS